MKKQLKTRDVTPPKLGRDIAFLLCAESDGGYQSLNDGDYSIQLFGNSKGFRKLGRYFLALADLDTSDDQGFHHHFFKCEVSAKQRSN